MQDHHEHRKLLAFVHIEKAAGTTLNYLLRRNFFFRFIDVRPLHQKSKKIFRPEDLRTYLRINPLLRAISGHSVQPWTGLDQIYPGIEYVTVLRDPVKRYVSQFRYLVSIGNKPNDFQRFLSEDEFTNYQTKKLTGTEDLEAAKEMLATRMLEVGIVEEFDAFLLRLSKSLRPWHFDPRYRKRNITKPEKTKHFNLSRYQDDVLERNRLDIELYDFVRTTLIPQLNQRYGASLEADLETFRQANQRVQDGFRLYADYALRKAYYEPISNTIRRRNGLPAQGSY